MKEIVKMTGLSIATVSRVLNEETEHLVKPATRERVWGAVRKLNYIPDRMARSLRTRRSNTIGFLMNFRTDTMNGYIQEIMNGVTSALAGARYDLKIVSAERFESLEDIMKTHGLDGLILPHAYRQAFPNLAKESGKHKDTAWPVVVINDYSPRCHVNQLYSDNTLATASLSSYLIGKGYRQFYFIGSEKDSPDAAVRCAGLKDALQAREIPFDEKTDTANGHFREDGGYEAARALFAARPGFRGAIVCANDAMALGVIRALGELALVCPRDVAVVGFDGIAMGEYSNPPLTTVKFELHEMGKAAVQILDNIINGRQKTLIKKAFPFRLLERGSCRG